MPVQRQAFDVVCCINTLTMTRTFLLFFTIFIVCYSGFGQKTVQKVFTSDIDNFWRAFDSVETTTDSLRQLHYIQSMYIDKGSKGLKAFMEARNYTAAQWVQLINKYPKFWRSIRPNTLTVKTKAKDIEQSIERLRVLYPQLKEAKMYFTVGGLRSGGTTMDHMVLIGTEIATGDRSTDVSEFPNKWLEGVFKSQQQATIIPLNIHEYIHTQQRGEPHNLLAQAIKEGSCDFITEIVLNKPLQNNYLQYGRKHEQELKEQFIQDMFTPVFSNWLYNGSSTKTVADLGYFMGYSICKAYYNKSRNKRKAIKGIIELNYSDTIAVEKFLENSRYYTESLNKAGLLQQYDSKRPYVLGLEPFSNRDSMVDASLKEMKILFSKPMNTKGFSISDGSRGREYDPISGIIGFSEDGKAFVLKIDMKPNHEYEFNITDKSFRSKEGYPLKPMEVHFKTK
jgi:hypothetical protein